MTNWKRWAAGIRNHWDTYLCLCTQFAPTMRNHYFSLSRCGISVCKEHTVISCKRQVSGKSKHHLLALYPIRTVGKKSSSSLLYWVAIFLAIINQYKRALIKMIISYLCCHTLSVPMMRSPITSWMRWRLHGRLKWWGRLVKGLRGRSKMPRKERCTRNNAHLALLPPPLIHPCDDFRMIVIDRWWWIWASLISTSEAAWVREHNVQKRKGKQVCW